MDGWIISKEDDDLVENLDVLDENTFEYLIKKRIYQNIDTFSVITAEAPTQHPNEDRKIRPCMVVMKKENGKIAAFQITSVGPTGDKRSSNKSPISYKRYGLVKPSYINYDHFVFVDQNHLNKDMGTELSFSDIENLYENIINNYERLITYSFKGDFKKDLDAFIESMERRLGIIDSPIQKK